LSRSAIPKSKHGSSKGPLSESDLSLPKTYDPAVDEPKWQEYWQGLDMYHFDPEDNVRSTYSIDTPPPYPSGEFHVGNALNWSYIDFVARYKRMRGLNVHFPQGWDCHGLPTEVRAEKTFKIRKNDLPPAKFIEICRNLSEEYISKMRETIVRLGISCDWNLEYRTMDPGYYKLTQLSFLILYKSGHMYKGEHPVNWCPRDETAIAEAEVVYVERQGNLHYMRFGDSAHQLEIASTRPELLGACVAIAVHPEDARFKSLVGTKTIVPVFGQTVSVIADEDVDPKFGTGAVMVCTYGDKMDVKWQKKYGLPVIREIAENGRVAVVDPRFKGLKIEDARKKAVEELKNEGRLVKTEQVKQNIGTCWRCNTPVEIIARLQWFMRTRDLTSQVTSSADHLRWVPSFSKQRLVDWTLSLDWDWVVSRQRIFGTPIPVWFCQQCNETIVADETRLPADPRTDPPPVETCPKCGSHDLKGETDVFDTWMDSSITAAVHAGWPSNATLFKRLFPADLQPNGLDIVRTWDYYLLVRSLAIFQKPPYKTLLINGMVRGTDGRMMHKSYGNFVETGEVIRKLGADAFRQWAASGGVTGYDIPFRWNEAEYGKKFLTKLWNIARFIAGNSAAASKTPDTSNLSSIDLWLLGSLQQLIETVTDSFEDFQFNTALEAIRDFTWHSLADDYIESVKYRLQPDSAKTDSENATYCLRETLLTICKLLSPICPHITEAIYQEITTKPSERSIHAEEWPKPDKAFRQNDRIQDGRLIIEAIAQARRKKSEKGLSLKSPIEMVIIRTQASNLRLFQTNQEPILRTIKSGTVSLVEAPQDPENPSSVRVEIVP
jgi:valyl-tRNA synthetase